MYDVAMTFAASLRPMRSALRSRGSAAACAVLGTTVLLSAGPTHADPVTVVNALRAEGCGREPSVEALVQPDPILDDVARALSRNYDLEGAIERAAYPAASSTSFHVRGSREDETVRRILAERYCASINDPRYDEIGVYARGDETWIVLGVRQSSLLPTLETDAVAERVLALVNGARAQARWCGLDRYEAARPLALSSLLNDAAAAHARDMATRGSLGHRGSDTSAPSDRITRTGYRWQASGENLAAGQRDPDAAVAAWLQSPAHCATLMNPHFTETGVAFALAPSKNPAIYWTQVFAAPLNSSP